MANLVVARKRLLAFTLSVLVYSSVNNALAEDVLVAVAANVALPLQEVVDAFEQGSEHRVQLSVGSSGRLYAQIRNGAPFQLFFSADQAKPEALEQAGLIVEQSRFTYAVGALVLWSASAQLSFDGPEALSQNGWRRLALANPAVAPYGLAAQQTLMALGLEQSTKQRWVLGENIAQVYQFVRTGNAELGFVAASLLTRDGQLSSDARGRSWRVPAELHEPIRQDAVLLDRAATCDACSEFLHFVRGDVAQAIFASYGYSGADN